MQTPATAQDTPCCRRERERAPILRPSTLRVSDAPRDVRVEDFSPAGFAFTSDIPVPTGTIVHVGLAGAGRASAHVVWRRGDRHGCLFEPALTAAQIEAAFAISPDEAVTALIPSGAPDQSVPRPTLAAVPSLILLAVASIVGWMLFAAGLRNLPFF